jgi:hypothetical protein
LVRDCATFLSTNNLALLLCNLSVGNPQSTDAARTEDKLGARKGCHLLGSLPESEFFTKKHVYSIARGGGAEPTLPAAAIVTPARIFILSCIRRRTEERRRRTWKYVEDRDEDTPKGHKDNKGESKKATWYCAHMLPHVIIHMKQINS